MKKILAVLLVLALMLACLPGAAMAEGYKSKLLKKTIQLPGRISLAEEEKLEDGSGVQLTFSLKDQPNIGIYASVQLIKEYKGYTMNTLPENVVDGWTNYYYEYYPENAVAGLLPPDSGKGDSLYCYCGQGADGGSLAVYASLQDQVFVCATCVSEENGLPKIAMQATLEVLNAVNAAVVKSAAGSNGKAAAPVYSHNDYDVLFVFLLLEDDDDELDLYADDDFDFDYADYDEDGWDDGSYDGDYGDYDGGYEDYGDYDGGYEDYGDYDDGGDW